MRASTLTEEMPQDTSLINGLRAFAAYWVLVAHCMIWAGWSSGTIPDPKIAVDIFMVISGFLMAFTLSAREPKEPMSRPSSWLRFYVKRWFRLAPAYYLSLVLVIVLASQFLGGYADLRAMNPDFWNGSVVYDPARIKYTLTNIVLHLTFAFGLHPTYSFSTFLPDWSLSLEMQFYVAFPFIFLAMRRFGAGKVAIALAALSYAATWALKSAVETGHMTGFYEPSLLVFRLPIFLAGVLIYEASATQQNDEWRRAFYIALAVGFCLGMANHYKFEILLLVTPVALMAVILTPAQRPGARFALLLKICKSRAVTYLSDISYSVYLFHGLFIAIVGSRITRAAHEAGYSVTTATLVVTAAVTVLTTAFAFAMYRFVELPGMRIGAALLDRHRQRATAQTSA